MLAVASVELGYLLLMNPFFSMLTALNVDWNALPDPVRSAPSTESQSRLSMLGGLGPAGLTGPPVETPKGAVFDLSKKWGSPIGEHRRCEDRVAAGPGDGVCGGGTTSPVPSRL